MRDLEDSELPQRPSKTRRKREMHELQDLGSALVGLSAERLARVELPDLLRRAAGTEPADLSRLASSETAGESKGQMPSR